jgi:hypothetical protein
MFPVSLSGTEVAFLAAGFFAFMWIVSLWKLSRQPKREKRWYSTDIPSTLHIEHEA